MKIPHRLLRITQASIAFAFCAHSVMDFCVVEPWPYMGLHWWARTLKGALGLWIAMTFWELLRASFNGKN